MKRLSILFLIIFSTLVMGQSAANGEQDPPLTGSQVLPVTANALACFAVVATMNSLFFIDDVPPAGGSGHGNGGGSSGNCPANMPGGTCSSGPSGCHPPPPTKVGGNATPSNKNPVERIAKWVKSIFRY